MNQLDIFSQTLQARKINEVYFNSTQKKGKELEAAQVKASGQTEKILRVFQNHPHTWFTPYDLYRHFGEQMDRNSIRRSMTNLTTAGYLIKGTKEQQRIERTGQPNNVWKLKNKSL